MPTGATFENKIYPLVNQYYEGKTELLHPELYLTHLDELITEDESKLFAKAIESKLSNIVEALGDRFHPITISHAAYKAKDYKKTIQEYDRFVRQHQGPRLIYAGLGPDPKRAHIAFIGEEFINTTTEVIKLSREQKSKTSIEQAITVGTEIFASANLEEVRVVAIGENKTPSLKAGFEDPDTGLGWLISQGSKPQIYTNCKLS